MTRCLAALVLVALGAALLCAAPVPAPPKELTPEMLAGCWRLQWGAAAAGALALDPDGGYSCSLAPGSPVAYYGTWRLDGNTLVLTEWSYHTELGTRGGPAEYRVLFDVSKYPRLSGACGPAAVVLHSPSR